MAQYKTGTANVTNNSSVVTGNGTLWLSNLTAGKSSFKINGSNVIYTIASVDSNTQIHLTAVYAGPTASTLNYICSNDFTPNYDLYEPDFNDVDWPIHLRESIRIIDENMNNKNDILSGRYLSTFSYGAIANGNSNTLDSKGYTLQSAQAKWPNAGITSINQQVDWAAFAETLYQAKVKGLNVLLPKKRHVLWNNHADDKTIINNGVSIYGVDQYESVITGSFNGVWIDCKNCEVNYENFAIFPSEDQLSNQVGLRFGTTSADADEATLRTLILRNLVIWNHDYERGEAGVDSNNEFTHRHYKSVEFRYVVGSVIDSCIFRAHQFLGLDIGNDINLDRGDHSLTNCFFSEPKRISTSHIRLTTTSGFRVDNCKFISGTMGIYIEVPSVVSGNAVSQLLVSNTSFDGCKTGNIKVVNNWSSPFYSVIVDGCDLSASDLTAIVIDLYNTTQARITDNNIAGNYPPNIGTSCIKLRSCSDVVIADNTLTRATNGIDVDSTVSGLISSNLNTSTITNNIVGDCTNIILGSNVNPAGAVQGAIQLRNSNGTALDAKDEFFYSTASEHRIWQDIPGTTSIDIPSFVARNKDGNANLIHPTFNMQCYSDDFRSNSSFSIYRSRGTTSSRVALQNGDTLGGFSWTARGSSTVITAFSINVTSDEDFTNSNAKSHARFDLYSNGVNENTVAKMYFKSSVPTFKIESGAQLEFPDGTTQTTANVVGLSIWLNSSLVASNITNLNFSSGLTASFSGGGTVSVALIQGTSSQYFRGDRTLQTLNQAAVAGLTTSDSPTFVNTTLSGKTIGSILFVGTSGVISEDNTNLFWDNTNKRLGINVASPARPLDISSPVSTGLQIVYTGASSSSAGSGIILYQDDNAACASGDRLGYLIIGGVRDTSHTITNATGIEAFAAETWSSTASGADMVFKTAPKGTTSRTEKLRITSEGEIRVGADATNNITLNVTNGVVLNGTATVWKDVFFPMAPPKTTGAGNPTLVTWNTPLRGYSFAVSDVHDFDPQEFPHDGKQGATTGSWHIHWISRTNVAATRGVKWQLEYSIADINGVFPAPTTISVDVTVAANTADKTHLISTIGTFTTPNIAAQIYCRLTRIASATTSPATDPVVIGVHFHYELDTMGSQDIITK